MIIEVFRIGGEYYNDSSGIDWAKWLSVLIGSITLIIGYKIYRSLDVNKKLAEKQLNVVIDLVNAIEGIVIEARFPTDLPPPMCAILPIYFSNLKAMVDTTHHEVFDNKNIIFSYDILTLDYLHFFSHPLLPVSIARELRKLHIPSVSYFEKKNYFTFNDHTDITVKDYVLLSKPVLIIYPDEKLINQVIRNIKVVPNHSTLREYLKQVLKVKREIIQWLKQYSNIEINIEA